MAGATGEVEAGLRLQLLGGFRVWVDGQPIDAVAWERRLSASLVKLLALAPGHRLHREQVIESLWPAAEPATVRNRLDQTVHLARRSLITGGVRAKASAYLAQHHEHVLLAPGVPLQVDVDTFEAAARSARQHSDPAALEAALALGRGELLPDDPYEAWLVGRREALRQLRFELLRALAARYRAGGRAPAAITALQRLLAAEPADEAAHCALMRLYTSTGERHLALQQYQRLTEALRRELDAAPSTASQQLYQAILAEQPSVTAPTPPPATPSFTGSSRPTNLPRPLTSFIGRERALAEVGRRLGQTPLLTLTGPGGVGKTRLALEIAARCLDRYPDGVWLVDLAPLSTPTLVPQAVASALHLREVPDRELTQTVINHLADRDLLLLLDNCEHLVDACARFAERLLHACPRLQLLATSREPLGIPGEIVWPVPTLALPNDAAPAEPALGELGAAEAVRLFLDRAAAVQPHFQLTPPNARLVVEVCRRLDGMPLALELAAARLRALSVEQLLARLDDRFHLLTSGGRTALPRHRTLRAAIDWSYELLSESERTLLRRLTVFAGGRTLGAVEAVCVGDGLPVADVLDVLTRLVDKSFVLVEQPPGEARYRLLETIRQYALERLVDSGEVEAVRERHLAYYLALAERAEPELSGPEQIRWLDRLETDHDNYRAALPWSLEHGRIGDGLRLAAALAWFWFRRGYLSEGRRWLEAALAASDSDDPAGATMTVRPGQGVLAAGTARAKAMHGAAFLAVMQGDYARAEALSRDSLALCRDAEDRLGTISATALLSRVQHRLGHLAAGSALAAEALAQARALGATAPAANSLWRLGSIACADGDDGRGLPLLEASLRLYRQVGDVWAISRVLAEVAESERSLGRLTTSARLADESIALARAAGDKFDLGVALSCRFRVACRQGDFDRAEVFLREAVALFQSVGAKPHVASMVAEVGRVCQRHGDDEQAVQLWGAVASLCEASGIAGIASDRFDQEQALAAVQTRLAPETFAAAWAAGQAWPPEAAVARAQQVIAARAVPPQP